MRAAITEVPGPSPLFPECCCTRWHRKCPVLSAAPLAQRVRPWLARVVSLGIACLRPVPGNLCPGWADSQASLRGVPTLSPELACDSRWLHPAPVSADDGEQALCCLPLTQTAAKLHWSQGRAQRSGLLGLETLLHVFLKATQWMRERRYPTFPPVGRLRRGRGGTPRSQRAEANRPAFI